VLLARGRSYRTTTDPELIRWGADYVRIEGSVEAVDAAPAPAEDSVETSAARTVVPRPGDATLEFALAERGRKKIAVNGVPRRPAALADHLRAVLFAPEEMLLVIGPPALRRTALDDLAAPQDPAYAANQATYGRALQQRNSLLRAIRENEAERDQLRLWDEPFLAAGSAIVGARRSVLAAFSGRLAAAHREIAPAEGTLTVEYATNAAPLPGEEPRATLARRLAETAEKEVWNGSTLIGPHRDDLVFRLDGRDLATFASRGQQRTAILAFKLAELDLLTVLDGRPPLLLLDDVFSELDPDRRGHLVRRIAALPQALITTTHLDDIDPELRRHARSWRVVASDAGATVEEAES
jgi:DNA replication and repair protein RecF